MGEPHAFERDPHAVELATEVVATGVEDGRAFAVLADTILYPEGGGQPADRGLVGEVQVSDVQRHGEEIRHYLTATIPIGPAVVSLDWQRRFDHMQQHTAQHVLTAVAADRFGWSTTAFHLGAEASDVELAVPGIAPNRLRELEEEVAVEVRANRAVSARRVTPEEYASLAVRSRGLPAGHTGSVRLVEIAGLDCNTCGGTHVRSTAELESVALLGTEALRGGTRVFFVAGGRERCLLAAHQERNARLRGLLGAPDAELQSIVELRLAEVAELSRRLRHTEEELAAALAEALASRPQRLLEADLAGRDGAFLQRLARQVLARAPDRAVFLTAAQPAGALFLVAIGERLPLDTGEVGRAVAAALGGRGGGAQRVFQGKAPDLAGRAAALAAIEAACR